MLCVAYDAITRRSELIAIDVEDPKFVDDGSGRLLIRRSKTDQAGEGHVAYLSCDSVRYLKAWLKVARIKEGTVFRRFIGRGTVTYDKMGEGRIGGSIEPGGSVSGVQGGGAVSRTAGRGHRGRQRAFGTGRGDAGRLGPECGFGVGHARGAVEDGADADAVRRASHGRPGRDGKGGQGAGKGHCMSGGIGGNQGSWLR